MKRILFILLMLTTCLVSPYAQKQKKTTRKQETKQQITKKQATTKEATKQQSAKKQAEKQQVGKRQSGKKQTEKQQTEKQQPTKKQAEKQQTGKQKSAKQQAEQQQTAKQQPNKKQADKQKAGKNVQQKKTATSQKKLQKGGKQQVKYVTTEEIKGLQQQNQQIQKEITENEQELKVKQKDVDSRLQKILTLDTEIGQQQKTIDNIATDIKGIDGNIDILKGQLKSLESQLGERRSRFIHSMRYMARHRSIQDKLMFVFSAKTLTQMYRRLRFVREYAAYQRAQGELLKQKQNQVDEKHDQLARVRGHKSNLLVKGRQVHSQMESKKVEQQKVVESLQNDQKVLQSVISDRQKKQQAINAQIDRLIAIEIRKVRERAMEEARAQAAARAAAAKQRADQQAREAEANRMAAERKAAADRERADREQAAANRANENSALLSSADRAMTGSFANNKGRLPMPVSGRIVKRFGTYNVSGLSHVKLSSNGIAIKASAGSPVRSVFKGEVTSVSHVGGSTLVMVRHGAYISVYLNLGSVSVSKGQQVGTGQTLGTVDSSGIFQFQLHKETQKLNPEQWLR